jgi:hypothetical protein
VEIYTALVFRHNLDISKMPELKKYSEEALQSICDQTITELLDRWLVDVNAKGQWAKVDYVVPMRVTNVSE